jgi:hypothetical protein
VAAGTWLAATAVVLTTAAAAGHDPLATETRERWDSEHYLSIAAEGYVLEPCQGNPRDWCGNAGWFPAYRWLVRVLAAPGLALDAVALFLWLALALATVLLLATATLLWFVPLSQGNVGLYRTAAALVPRAPLVARLSAVPRVAACAAAVALAVSITLLFLRGVLI